MDSNIFSPGVDDLMDPAWDKEKGDFELVMHESDEEEEEDDVFDDIEEMGVNRINMAEVADNPAHAFVKYKDCLTLGVISDYLNAYTRTLDDVVEFLNNYILLIHNSPNTKSMTYHVLCDSEDGIQWVSKSKGLLLDEFKGFTVEVDTGKRDREGDRIYKHHEIMKKWMENQERNWVKYICYDPNKPGGIDPERRFLNTFGGFPFHNIYRPGLDALNDTKAKEILNTLVSHLRWVICRGNKEIYRFIKKWLRMVRQHPDWRPEIVLICIGEEGCGKSIFFRFYNKVFGNNAVYLDEPKDLFTRFTGDHLDNKVLICADEVNLQDKEFGPRLKNLVTSEKVRNEKKGVSCTQRRNYLNGIFTANDMKCMPVSNNGKNRRYFPVESDPEYVGNKQYFRVFAEMMDNEFALSVFDFWLRIKKVKPERMEAPVTQELQNMKMSSLNKFQEWWLKCINDSGHYNGHHTVPSICKHCGDGHINGTSEILCTIGKKMQKDWLMYPVNMYTLHEHYKLQTKSHNPIPLYPFMLKLKNLLPEKNTNINFECPMECEIPGLLECKEFACKKLGVQSDPSVIPQVKQTFRPSKRYKSDAPGIKAYFPSLGDRQFIIPPPASSAE